MTVIRDQSGVRGPLGRVPGTPWECENPRWTLGRVGQEGEPVKVRGAPWSPGTGLVGSKRCEGRFRREGNKQFRVGKHTEGEGGRTVIGPMVLGTVPTLSVREGPGAEGPKSDGPRTSGKDRVGGNRRGRPRRKGGTDDVQSDGSGPEKRGSWERGTRRVCAGFDVYGN